MKIIITDGCTCGSIEIDGKDINDLTPEEKSEAWYKVLEDLKINGNPEELNDLLWWLNSSCHLLPNMEQKHLYHCDTCGDNVYETKWEV